MAKRKEGCIEATAKAPWPIGIVLSVLTYWRIRYGFGWHLSSSGNPYFADIGKIAATGIYAPHSSIFMELCDAFESRLGGSRRKQLLEAQIGFDSLCAMRCANPRCW